MTGSKYAVLVAVEQYQQSNIRGVPFAVADAAAMKNVLVQQMKIPVQNITLWTNEDATTSRLENDLPYEIKQLGPDDLFIFFYAGHGFYAQGSNRLTTWDTHTFNIGETTVCLEKVLLSPLRNGHCRKSLVFIDACATTFGDADTLGRNVLQGMRPEEFSAFVRSTDYRAAFFSCSPNQQSFSSEKLQHGIWTHYLLRALSGQDEAAFERDRCITGNSLHTYLAVSVPAFITNETDFKTNQRPHAELAANGAFEILHVPESTVPADVKQPRAGANPRPPTPSNAQITAVQKYYWAQRKRLGTTPVMDKIWQLPRWRIWSRPLEFRKARFQSLDHCAQFVAANCVRSNATWTMYPWFNTPPEHGFESVAAEIDLVDPSVEHTERWVLFQSGQFIHNMAVDRAPAFGKRMHVLEVLDVTTALFEFIARMADKKVFTNHAGISFEILGAAGRQLGWRNDLNLDGWCQEDAITIDNIYTAEELRSSRRKLALDAALEIYAHFGWEHPPKIELEAAQRQRFGSA